MTMVGDIRALVREPWFVFPAIAKLLLVALLRPELPSIWFSPFLQSFLTSPSFDPWTSYLATGGSPLAFPYGPVMLLVLVPGTAVGFGIAALLGLPVDSATQIGFALGLFVIDVLVLLVLRRLFLAHADKVLKLYWLSPITLYVIYWHGQLDVVPVLFLLTSLLFLREHRFRVAGVLFGVAVATKLSMVLAGPFLLIYLFRNNRLRPQTFVFALLVVVTALVVQGTYLASSGVRQMVLGTPEAAKVFDVVLNIDGVQLYVLPLAYLLSLYAAWRVRRISFELLIALLGLGFFMVLLLTPASPGWYLWIVPFLVHHQLNSGRQAMLLSLGFSLLLVGFHLFQSSGAAIPFLGLDPANALVRLGDAVNPKIGSLWLTVMSATGIVLAIQMVREGVQGNDYYRLSRRPLMIGISGDSGTGKDTLAGAMEVLFGSHSVANLSGDDYHLWDRHRPMWRAMTHLNPRANDLEKFNADVLRLADGRPVTVRRYDHETGRYSKPRRVKHNDVLVVSGLHALYSPTLRQRSDVKVFLNMEESLRRALKVARDVGERGHGVERVLESIESRRPDAQRFIKPQAEHADILFSLHLPGNDDVTEADLGENPQFCLDVVVSNCLFYEDMLRALVGLCGLAVNHEIRDDGVSALFSIEGHVLAEDIDLAASWLVSHIDELLDLQPHYQDGMLGVMQLFVLAQSAQALRTRQT